MNQTVVVLDNIRSAHNVGSILRTCDGFGIKQVYACGVTPYPALENDLRLPHVRNKLNNQISKTALGAEITVKVNYFENLNQAIKRLKNDGFEVWAIEQNEHSVPLNDLTHPSNPLAIVLGNEVEGVTLTHEFDKIVEIPMSGSKESFNVSVTAGIVIYQLCKK